MREIPPFCIKCEYAKYHPTSMCKVNELFYYWKQMWQKMPLIGRFVEDYNCQHFEKDDKGGDE